MSDDDKRLISWALRVYADKTLSFTDANRCRELADHFHPYDWTSTVVTSSKTIRLMVPETQRPKDEE